MVESESGNPDTEECVKGPSVCEILGCDGKVMCDERGQNVTPSKCGFSICRECYREALESVSMCRGCKHFHKICDPDWQQAHGNHGGDGYNDEEDSEQFHLPPLSKERALERRLSMLRSFKNSNPPLLMGKNTSEFDHARWLFKTKGMYGYGNAMWPKNAILTSWTIF